jgi:hypothetical protein
MAAPRAESGPSARARTLQAPEKRIKAETMTDLLNFAMLICASVGSMVFGILAAYGILRVGFALMRPRPRPVAMKTRPEAARVS